jgi:hypothetical protein
MSKRDGGLDKMSNEELGSAAYLAYQERDFSRELIYREELCRRLPTDPRVEHDLALSLMNNGDYERSLVPTPGPKPSPLGEQL